MKNQKEPSGMSGLLAGGFGGVAFISTFLWGGSFLAAAGVSFGVFFLSWYLLSSKPREKGSIGTLTQEFRDEILELGKTHVKEMTVWVDRIQNQKVRRKAEEIVHLSRLILKEVERDPKDLSQAKSFLNYHFMSVAKIIRQYVELSEKAQTSSSVQDSLVRVEASLDQISQAFKSQYDKLLSNDALDLDTELKVLEQTIQSEIDRKGR